MRILYLVQYFNLPQEPGGSRAYQFAKHWSSLGHEVEVVTGGVNHKTGQVVEALRGRPYHVEQLDGFRVRRVWSYSTYKGHLSRRYLSFLSYSFAAWMLAPRRWRPDVVFASSTPLTTGLAGAALALLPRRPFVFEARDLWPKAALVAGVLKEGAFYRAAARAESWIYARADDVVVVSRGDRDELIGRGLSPERVHWIPNGVDDWMLEREPASVPRSSGPLEVLYAGALGRWNQLGQILDLAAAVPDLAHFTMIGDGDEKPALEAEARSRGLGNVAFLDAMPKREAFERLCRAHVTILASGAHAHYDQWLPNKVFDYMAAGRPILVLGGGELQALVERAGCGVVCPPEDVAAGAGAVRALHGMPAQRLDAMGRAGWEAARHDYSRRDHAARMIEIFRGARSGSGRK